MFNKKWKRLATGTNMYFVFLFVEGPIAHTGQLMLRERQQKETNLRYNQPIVMTRVPIPPVAGRIIIQ